MKLIYGVCGVLALTGCVTMEGQRDYVANPFVLPQAPVATQPNFQPFGSQQDGQYRTIMFDTPNGPVYKQCKVFNSKIISCV